VRTHSVADLRHLPTYGFGTRMTMTWGTFSFVAIEGMGFAIVTGAYLYLAWVNPRWPLGPPPGLLWSGIFTAVVLASLIPNYLIQKVSTQENLPRVRLLLVVMSLVGLVLIGIRAMEFTTLMVSWDDNAYGSLIWFILGLHTTHLATDVGDTIVLTALMFTRHAEGKRFSDCEDNAFYWYFVVASWIPIYLLLYWFPRW
jgi:cytochrome c oxidase subunit 3